ncbi:MAG: imidazoleglycerol-phosphate dehydratase HisB [Anaerolineales bacterium]
MRESEIHRRTNETDIELFLNLDGTGRYEIHTGIGFLDHMLNHVALHGLFDLTLHARGDLEVDAHHTVEDCGLALGQAFNEALGDRNGLVRVGNSYVPMDDSLAFAAVDFSGRPYAVIQAGWTVSSLGELPTSLITHFFESLAVQARANVHARILYGEDDHHKAEALFKALGRALDQATQLDTRREGSVPSTKGTLE